MGKLSEQLRKEQADDARKAEKDEIRALVGTQDEPQMRPEGSSMGRIADMVRAKSHEQAEAAAEGFLKQNTDLLAFPGRAVFQVLRLYPQLSNSAAHDLVRRLK